MWGPDWGRVFALPYDDHDGPNGVENSRGFRTRPAQALPSGKKRAASLPAVLTERLRYVSLVKW